MKALWIIPLAFVALNAHAECARTATGRVVCGNGYESGSYNPNTGVARKSEMNANGVRTYESSTGAEAKTNLARLETILARTSGYFGIVNYQGAKFAADKASATPVLTRLSEKGLAFIDDGSFDRSTLSGLARETGLRYARATGPIDARQTPADISAELMDLEAVALEKGAAFGSGYAFPVTVEAAKVWISQLEEKGLVLAPVSAISNGRPVEVRTGSLDMSGLNTGG